MKKKKSKKLVRISKKQKIITRKPSDNDKTSKVKKIKAYQRKMRSKKKGFFSRLFGR